MDSHSFHPLIGEEDSRRDSRRSGEFSVNQQSSLLTNQSLSVSEHPLSPEGEHSFSDVAVGPRLEPIGFEDSSTYIQRRIAGQESLYSYKTNSTTSSESQESVLSAYQLPSVDPTQPDGREEPTNTNNLSQYPLPDQSRLSADVTRSSSEYCSGSHAETSSVLSQHSSIEQSQSVQPEARLRDLSLTRLSESALTSSNTSDFLHSQTGSGDSPVGQTPTTQKLSNSDPGKISQYSFKSSAGYISGSLPDVGSGRLSQASSHSSYSSRKSSFEAICQSRLSEYPIVDDTRKSSLSQYAFEDSYQNNDPSKKSVGNVSASFEAFSGNKFKGRSLQTSRELLSRERPESTLASGESSDPIAMFSTRPGTAIERVSNLGEGEACRNEPNVKKSKLDDLVTNSGRTILSQKTDAENQQQHVVPETSTYASMSLANSINVQHIHSESTLGETLLHDSKDPILASTPFVQKEKSACSTEDTPIPQLALSSDSVATVKQISSNMSDVASLKPSELNRYSSGVEANHVTTASTLIGTGASGTDMNISSKSEEFAATAEMLYPSDSVVDPSFTPDPDPRSHNSHSLVSESSATSAGNGSLRNMAHLSSMQLADLHSDSPPNGRCEENGDASVTDHPEADSLMFSTRRQLSTNQMGLLQNGDSVSAVLDSKDFTTSVNDEGKSSNLSSTSGSMKNIMGEMQPEEGITSAAGTGSFQYPTRVRTAQYGLYSPSSQLANGAAGVPDNQPEYGYVEASSLDATGGVVSENILEQFSSQTAGKPEKYADEMLSFRDDSSTCPADKSSFTVVTDLDQQSRGSSEHVYNTSMEDRGDTSFLQSALTTGEETVLPLLDQHSEEQLSHKSSNTDLRSEVSLSDRVAAILAEAPVQTVDSDTDYKDRDGYEPGRDVSLGNDIGGDTEDEEMERIAGEYRAALKNNRPSFSDSESNISGKDTSIQPESQPESPKATDLSKVSSTGSDFHGYNKSYQDTDQDTVEITKSTSNGVTEYSSMAVPKSRSKGSRTSGSKSSGSDSDDTLDMDVRNILAKYGRTLSDSEDDPSARRGARKSSNYRRSSPVGSVSESDDISHRVKDLLYGKPGNGSMQSSDSPLLVSGNIPSYLFDDPAKSMSLPMDLHRIESQESIPAAVTNQKKYHDLSADKLSVTTTSDVAETSKVLLGGDQITTRPGKSDVEVLVNGEVAIVSGSGQSSVISSRTNSLAGSVDFDHLEKDLDEMALGLETLKQTSDGGSSHGSRRSSEASQRSRVMDADKLSYSQASRKSDKVDLGFSSDGESRTSQMSQGFSPVTEELEFSKSGNLSDFLDEQKRRRSSYFKTDMDGVPEQSRSTYHSEGDIRTPKNTDLGVHALLTSNVIPLDIALDIVHGYDYPLRATSRMGDSPLQKSNRSGYDSSYARSLPETRYTEAKDRADLTSSDRDLAAELREYRGSSVHRPDSPEKIHDVMEKESPTTRAMNYLRDMDRLKQTSSAPGADNDGLKVRYSNPNSLHHVEKQEQEAELNDRHGHSNTAKSPGLSFNTTPVSHSPIRALGNFKSLFSSHLDKVTAANFDKSIELRTPYRHHMEEHIRQTADEELDRPVTIEHDRATNRYESSAFSLYDETGSRREQRLGSYDYYGGLSEVHRGDRVDHQHGRGVDGIARTEGQSPTIMRLSRNSPGLDLHRPSRTSGTSCHREDQGPKYARPSVGSPLYTQTTSPGVGGTRPQSGSSPDQPQTYSMTSARSSSPASRTGHLRPYRPVGSQEMYYVESGTEDGTSTVTMSESTMESTHLGSDDARGPQFPSGALGSRVDSSSSSEGIYYKKKEPGEEVVLSTIQEQPSFDSRDTESAKSKSDDTEKSKKDEEKERSFKKAEDWVNGMENSGTPRDPNDKDTPRDNLGSEAQVLQDEVQPHHAIDAKGKARPLDPALYRYGSSRPEDRYSRDIHNKSPAAAFGTPQKSQFGRSAGREQSSLFSQGIDSLTSPLIQGHNANDLSGSYNRADASKSTPILASYSSGYPLSALKLADDSISPVVPFREGSNYDPVTSAVNYGNLRYTQGDNSYSLSGALGGGKDFSPKLKLRNVSFSPLRPDDQDTDDLLEEEDIPGKPYPSTPHPRSGRLSLDPESALQGSRSSSKHRSSDPSSFTDQSVLSDQMARFDDSKIHKPSRNRSPGLGLEAYKRGNSPLFGKPRDQTDNRSRSRSRSRSPGARQKRSPSPQQKPFIARPSSIGHTRDLSTGPLTPDTLRYGASDRLGTWSPTSRSNTLSPDRMRGNFSSDSSASRPSPNPHPTSFSPSRHFETYDEDRLQRRLKYVMERLSPGVGDLPSNVNDMWERFLESRNQSGSEANSSEARSTNFGRASRNREEPSQQTDDTPQWNENSRHDFSDSKYSMNSSQQSSEISKPSPQVPRIELYSDNDKSDTERRSTKEPRASPPLYTKHRTEDISRVQNPVIKTSARDQEGPSQDTKQFQGSRDQGRPQSRSGSAESNGKGSANMENPDDLDSRNNVRVSEALAEGLTSRKKHVGDRGQMTPLERETSKTPEQLPQVRETQVTHAVVRSIPDQTEKFTTLPAPESKGNGISREQQEKEARSRNRVSSVNMDQQTTSKQTTSQGASAMQSIENGQPSSKQEGELIKKTAYLIKDETLASVPEDSTLDSISSDFTTSSYESDGKVIMKTTKRHLPDDPKLLRLQHKILKQKEKYKHDRLRELKRKEKIAKLERVLAERNIVLDRTGKTVRMKTPEHHHHQQQHREEPSQESSQRKGSAVKSPKKTSTPSAPRYVPRDSTSSDCTTLTMSDITTSSTMTPSSFNSEDNTLTSEMDTTDLIRQGLQWQVLDESHKCSCRENTSKPQKRSKSSSPTRKPPREVFGDPEALHLQRVGYAREERPVRVTRATGGSYMEFDKPASMNKPKRSKSKSPARRPDGKENDHKASSKQQHRKEAKELSNEQAKNRGKSPEAPRTPADHKRKDFGQTCPTSIAVSPARVLQRHDSNTVTMVSQAIQTQSTGESKHQRNKENHDVWAAPRRSGKGSGMFTPDGSLHIQEKVLRDRGTRENRPTVSAGQCGLSWFIPVEETKPWRKPFRERQAYALSMDTRSGVDSQMSRKMRALDMELQQEAFESHKQEFVSRSRERQRIVALRAEERRIQDLHDTERERLFAVKKKMEANLYALPISELHFNPQKRKFSKKEMREQTKRKYNKLPEVIHKVEEQKKQDSYKTNRLKAKLFRQKIQNHVLNKRSGYYQ